MRQPDSSDQEPSREEKPASKRASLTVAPRNEVTAVARTLAAYGGGALAYDLALDLVLNEVVEQARIATGATGAAIALTRDGEMECRATTGADAPDLGVRLETVSGLSGACLKTGEIQHCFDTETDGRVDAEACRQLGVRSMVVVPLNDGKGPFGILEVLSAQPNAFGDHDVAVLQALSQRIAASKREAEMGNTAGPQARGAADPPIETALAPRTQETSLDSAEAGLFAEPELRKGSDIWTTVLVLLVIAAAVALGVVIGWRGAAKRWMTESHPRPSALPTATVSQTPTPAEQTIPAAPEPSTEPIRPASASQPSGSRAGQTSTGGLVVTQNGKVIYRLSPPAAGASNAAKRTASESSSTQLIHQVAPEYPNDAKAQHIQGAVVLEVQVLSDGRVGNIGIVTGNPLLAEAAVHAVRQWIYQPNLVDGHPVESQTRIKINFTLPPTN